MELKSGITQAKLNPLPGSQAGEEPAALPTGSASSPLLLSSYPGHAFKRYFETVCVFSFMLLAVVKLLPQGEDFYSVTKEKQTTPVFSFRAQHFYNLISSDCTAFVTGHRPYR